MNVIKLIPVFIVIISITGCATTNVYTYSINRKESICDGNNVDLGSIVVLPESAWRKDQKEPIKRNKMALNEINKIFKNIPCGNISSVAGIKEFSNWSGMPEAEMLKNFSNESIDTIIIIRIEELTPRLEITFSVPFLWIGTNEADFRVRVISVKTGEVLNDMRIKRVTGGPFNIRPAQWSRYELNAALQRIVK